MSRVTPRPDLETYAETHPMPESIVPALAQWIGYWMRRLPPSPTVLEFGSGDGRVLRHLRDRHPNARVVGIEASMKRCRRMAEDSLQCIYQNSPPLPFKDQSIDLIMSFEVFEHIPESALREYLAEFARVLKRSGMLWASTPNYPAKRIHDWKRFIAGQRATWRDDPTHVNKLTWRGFERALCIVFGDVEIRSSAVPHSVNPARGALRSSSLWTEYKLHGFAFGPTFQSLRGTPAHA